MIQTLLQSGEFFSLLAALLWATAVILFRRSGDRIPPVALNCFKSVLALLLVMVTMLLLGIPFRPPEQSLRSWGVLLASGFLGIAVADTLFFAALNRLGAGRIAIVDCLYSPGVLAFSALFLHEPAGWSLGAAVVLMVAAILLGAWEPGRRESEMVPAEERKELRLGVLFGAVGILCIAGSIVMAKPVLDHANPWWVSFVRLLGGLAFLSPQGLSRRHRGSLIQAFRPGPAWRTMVPASIVGMYLALMCWTMGMKLVYTNLASVLNQLSNVFLMLLAWLVLKERLGPRQWLAVLLGFSAAVLAIR